MTDSTADPPRWLIYGANGYTGRLIAAEAVARGFQPILAGRNKQQIQALAERLDCQARVFHLNESAAIVSQLSDVAVVLHCAGPFSQSAQPMMDACLASGTHYLDITGEIEVIEWAAARGEQASRAAVTLMPAVGFDVVPSDCLARTVADSLENPVALQLAFAAGRSVSPGTARTVLENVGHGGRVRKQGKIVRVPTAWKSARIPFADKTRQAVTIPWGDVASAFYSTGIPDIEVYCAQPGRTILMLKLTRWSEPLFRLRACKRLVRWWIGKRVSGPSEQQRRSNTCHFWARAVDQNGRACEATLETPDGYATTIETSLEIVQRVLAGEVSSGFLTPAMAFGATFIERFPTMKLRTP